MINISMVQKFLKIKTKILSPSWKKGNCIQKGIGKYYSSYIQFPK